MANKTTIEWTGTTWNPIRGCTRISPGCEHCYAERIAARFSKPGFPYEGLAIMTKAGPRWTGKLRTLPELLDQPLRWRKPRTVFVDSTSDLFHERVPCNFIGQVFEVMNRAPQHTFQVLTKRSQRLLKLDKALQWTPNIWMGVSVENEDYQFRIDHLHQTQAAVKFLSLEPLLGPLSHLDLEDIHWVIVGGESGPKARPMQEKWVLDIRDQCLAASVSFFFKQWGGTNKKRTGRLLEGRTWDERPQ